MKTKSKLTFFLGLGVLLLAVGIGLILIKCGDEDKIPELKEKVKEIVIKERIEEQIQASYEDTAQYYAGRALTYQLKADSTRGDTSLRAVRLKELESKIRVSVEARRNK